MANEISQQSATAEVGALEHTRSGQFYRPDVDIVEMPEELLILADMPGVDPDEVEIDFQDGALSIHGRVTNGRVERESFLLREYGIGDYYRTFRISEQIDPSGISAELTDGVLTLHLPKAEAAKPRKIKVAVK
ncbi:MAG TPA: Hsp20/alpha crystallin family protein [Pirellulales bacterium]|jgi:HSP20 family protein|nr:Hsp20/alpha crystallin family protein [Pirellulales bacterium]